MSGDIYSAKQSFSIRWNGHPLVVHTGATIREGHPLLVAYPTLFERLFPDFEHVTPDPEPEPVKPPPPPKVAPPKVTASPKPAAAGVKVDDKE